MEDVHPFARRGFVGRLAPFVGVACLAFVLVPLPPAEENASALLGAAWLCLLIMALALLAPWKKLPPGSHALAPLAYFVVIALLREAEGGSVSGYGTLVLLPIC